LKALSCQIEGADYLAFPSPDQIKNLDIERVNLILKNERKSEYLMALAQAFSQVDEEFLRNGNIDEVKSWLMDIRGIGEWSASLVLIRGFERTSIFQKMMKHSSNVQENSMNQRSRKKSLGKLARNIESVRATGLII
jgi:DNA-3-methyladenine glycosylase II